MVGTRKFAPSTVLIAVALLSLFVVARASAAGVVPDRIHAWTAKIAAPLPGAVERGRSIRIVVDRRPTARSFRVTLRGHRLKGAFHADGRRESATLTVGATPGLRFGRNTVRVKTGDGKGRLGSTSVSFFLVRRSAGLLRGVSAPGGWRGGAPLRVSLGHRGTKVAIEVNRRPTLRRRVEGRRLKVALDADDGVRPGANTIKVEAVNPAAGLYAVRRVHLHRPAGVPVAGAGASQRVGAGHWVKLDATNSRLDSAANLRYRWRILSAPKGSRARLRGVTRPQPTLRPDRPGHYVLEVGVAKAGSAAGASLSSAEEGEPFSAESNDMTTLTVAVPAPPIGAAIDTIEKRGAAVGVRRETSVPGEEFIPAPAGAILQLVVLDRETLALEQNLGFANSPAGAGELLAKVNGLSSSQLVIVSKPTPTATSGESTAATATINQALGQIGAAPVPVAVATGAVPCGQTGACSSFSAIGVPGIPVDQGDLNPGLASAPESGLAGGDLHGYLQLDLEKKDFVYINRERTTFDTGAPGEDPAKVTVGNATYESSKLNEPGFFVVVLDAGSLLPLEPATTYDLKQSDSAAVGAMGGLEKLHLTLTKWANDPSALVIVRSIGAVSRRAGFWDVIANDLQALGGSRYYVEALNGRSSEFAQVGPGGNGGPGLSPWTQVATQDRNRSGRLTGLLARSPSSQLYPAEATTPGTKLLGSLGGLLSLPPEAFPLRNIPADKLVMECIGAKYDLGYPIERSYSGNGNIPWGAKLSKIRTESLSELEGYKPEEGSLQCGSITEEAFRAVKVQLETEWEDILTVNALIKNLESPFTGPAGSNADLQAVADKVNEVVQPSGNVEYHLLGIITDVFWIASGLEKEAGAVSNLISAGLALASEFDLEADGSNALTDVTASANELGAKLQRQYREAINGLEREGSIILTNWNMMQIAAKNALGGASAIGDWSWPSAESAPDVALEESSRRLDYETLFPDRYSLYRAQKGTGSLNPEDVTSYRCIRVYLPEENSVPYEEEIYPFAGTPRYGGVAPVVSGAGEVEQWVYAGSKHDFLERATAQTTFPTESLLRGMFAEGKPPLFSPLSFALETYANGSKATTVTHVERQARNHPNEACRLG